MCCCFVKLFIDVT